MIYQNIQESSEDNGIKMAGNYNLFVMGQVLLYPKELYLPVLIASIYRRKIEFVTQ